MSASPPPPRRSQRDRKSVKPFNSAAAASSHRKRKRNETEDDDDAQHATEPESQQPHDGDLDAGDKGEDEESAEGGDEDEDNEEEYRTAKVKGSGTGRRGKRKTTPRPRTAAGVPPSKKPRKARTTLPKPPKGPMARRGRKSKEGVAGQSQTDQQAKDTNISNDNVLFNALVNPAVPLQSTAEDFMESLRQTPGSAQAELVNLILRCCGCNDSVDADSAIDYDGVVDALDNFTEGLKQENSPIYPLTSKLPTFKKFRRHLAEFIDRLISAAAELGLLYSTDLMATLQTWVVAMSSSQIRSFRHTATVIALELETALCDVAATVEKEAEVVARQREGERKRKTTNKSPGAASLKELGAKAKEIRKRRDQVSEFLKEFVDGVFVHRYRDLDSNIRAECVRAIGLWFKKYPSHFLDGSYLRYVGWVLSDSSNHVRLEAIRALSNVYDQADFISSLNHFTERFKPRLIEMATMDIDVSVRVAVIRVLEAIDGYSLLEEEEREKLCLLVFNEEPRVRKAVSGFIRGIWNEGVDERTAGRKGRKKWSNDDQDRVGIKALAALVVQWGKTLDMMVGDDSDSEVNVDVEGEVDGVDVGEGQSGRLKRQRQQQKKQRKELVALSRDAVGRTALVVEALWGEVDPVRDWEGLLNFLLLDHSPTANGLDEDELPERVGTSGKRGNDNGKKGAEENGENGESEDSFDVAIDEAWRLEEVEEGILLEVLVAAIRKAKTDAIGGKKGEEETVANDITRALIKGLPRLFIKHRIDTKRIAEILLLPTMMNLDLYLEMRMITSYAGLWDDVTKLFLSHPSLTVLARAVSAIRYFLDATSLSNTNATKITELEEELSSTLHDAVAGREEIEVATFNEDEVLALGAICSRLAVLFGVRDMTGWMEEDEGGKQSNAWDIVSALSERGRLGYKEEEMMVEQALQTLTLHIMWKARGLTAAEEPSADEAKYRQRLVEQRESLLEKLIEYAIGGRSNAVEVVKRSAFKNMLDLYVLFSPVNAVDAEGARLPMATVPLILDDEIQYRCAGYMQAEIERYSELISETEEKQLAEKESGTESEGSATEKTPKANVAKKKPAQTTKVTEKQSDVLSRDELEEEYLFIDVVATYLRAIRAGTINARHGAVLLAHYGRLGPTFDACIKIVIDVLREEGMMYDDPDVVVVVVTQAMQEAFNLVLDGIVQGEDNCVQLAKALSSCLAIRGSQLSIIKRLEGQYVVQIHVTLLSYIVKRLTAYEKNKNKKSLRTAVSFFRTLVPLLLAVQSKDALEIKAHMDQALAQAKLEPSPASKIWEPQRAYEKRLGTALSKDKPAGSRGRKGKGAAAATDESEAEKTGTDDEVMRPQTPPRARSRPRRVTRAHPDVHREEAEPEALEDGPVNTNGDEGDEVEEREQANLATPKSSALRTQGSRTPEKQTSPAPSHEAGEEIRQPSRELSPALDIHLGEPTNSEPSFVTPKLSRKRPRHNDDYVEVETNDAPQMSEEVTVQSPVGDLQIRRKRIRH
ncbi:hypothetical protein AX15_000952 [Amanita polypyramis BW_CC]|nr:hypothetical protein AX15_000952 [Amanita polypyramis BW_CC]